MSEVKLKLMIPNVPNYIIIDLGRVARRQDGFKEGLRMDIAHISDDQLCALADEWKVKLLDHAKLRRMSSFEGGEL